MKTISIVSSQGGVGKSTIAANLAVTLTQRQQQVLVIDLDPQNSQALHLGLPIDEIAGLAREGVGPHAIFDSPFGLAPAATPAGASQERSTGLHFIPFGRVQAQELDEFMDELAEDPAWLRRNLASLEGLDFDYILIDTPSASSPCLNQSLAASDLALQVVLPDAASYFGGAEFAEEVKAAAETARSFQGVYRLINRMPFGNKLAHVVREAMYAEPQAGNVPLVIHQDLALAQASAHQMPLHQYHTEHKVGTLASLDFRYLADWLMDSTKDA